MLNIEEFSKIIIECIENKILLVEDNASAFTQKVIIPFLTGMSQSYVRAIEVRKSSAFAAGDKIDEGTPEAFAFGVQKELRKKWPKIPKGEDKRDFDFYEDNKGFWYTIAFNYYKAMEKQGLTTSSNQTQRKSAIGKGMGKGSKLIHDSGIEGIPLSNNTKSIKTCFGY